MLKKNNIEKEIVEKNTTPLSQEIPVMPQAETSSQSDQVSRVAIELAGVPTTSVLINSNHDTRKFPVSNLHLVGTPVKAAPSERMSTPPDRLTEVVAFSVHSYLVVF